MGKLRGYIRYFLVLLMITLGLVDGNDLVYAESQNNLAMHVIDVGEGLSLLFESNSHYMLYDGGDREYSSKVVAYLKQQNVEKLDYVVVSHYDADHLNGIVGALNVFEVSNVIAPDYTTDTRVFESFQEIASEKGLDIILPVVGNQVSFGSTHATILAPSGSAYSEVNDYSIALRLQCNENSIVVTGDATSLSESEMLISGQNLDADILVVGHHGSDSSSSEGFIASVSPDIAVISCGLDNQYLHPTQIVMERLQNTGCEIFRTDKQDDFILSSDGVNWSYSEEPVNDYSYGVETIEYTDMYATTGVNVRSNSSTDSKILGQLDSGEKIAVAEINGDWATVSYNGMTAYVATAYLSDTELVETLIVVEEEKEESVEITYVLNNNSRKFHYRSCHSAAKIADHNRGESNESRDVLISRGYDPCGNCHP